ncbi:MAG TPA: GreA/GreB family elongation factor, partial [Verrucomicrobiae bacterium]
QAVLVPDVIADDWKKWWEAAKKELKKDGHFQLPTKKSDPIIYQQKETSLDERLLGEFRGAKGLKAKIGAANEFLKTLSDIKDKATVGKEMITALNADIASHQRTQPALALEAIFLRDEIRQASGLTAQEGELTEAAIWGQITRPAPLLEAMPAAKHKRGLQSFKDANPEKWAESLLASLNSTNAKLAGEMAELLIHNGMLGELKDHLAKLISQHQASSELLLWFAKERSDTFADILGPEVFRAMLTAMERDQFNEKRSNRLRDFILDDQSLLVELIGSADLEVIKDLTRALQLSPCFDDMDKRSLLARIVKSYPTIQSLISGESTRQDTSLIVSWESLERRKEEYNELNQKKIPANRKEIAIARSYGDLRENHEYKSAKEMQRLLMRRKAELETQLDRARGMDFTQAKTDQVNIGTRVRVTDLDSNQPETYSVLGAWDSNPDRHIVSYMTPFAQALLGKKVGEEAALELEGHKRRFRIEGIEPYVATAEELADANKPKVELETDHGTGHSA